MELQKCDKQKEINCLEFLNEDDIEIITADIINGDKKPIVENYCICSASDNILGFLADYWKLEIVVKDNDEKFNLSYFIKAVSRSNEAKADMVKDMKLFDKEIFFYSVVKIHLNEPGIKPWSPRLVAILNEALVFEDLNANKYLLRNKFKRFDLPHMFEALNTLARFHSSSLIFEEKKRKELKRNYMINEEFPNLAHVSGYSTSDLWFKQCMKGALAAIKHFSKDKFNEKELDKISTNWANLWSLAINIHDLPSECCNVICHRDLWNNNIMFHYKYNEKNDSLEPDDCVFVDFQGVRYQSPASDVMVLLYCNLEPSLRRQYFEVFLDHYYDQLKKILSRYHISIEHVMPKGQFKRSANEQSIWGLVVCSCLMPQFWIDDELTTKIFSNNEKFNEIMCHDKASFIVKMMEKNQDYKNKVMEVFNELAEKALSCNHDYIPNDD